MSIPEEKTEQQTVIPDFEIEAMAHCLLPALRVFYDSPEGKVEFERWKAEHNKTKE